MNIKKIFIASSLITTLIIPNAALAEVIPKTKITGTINRQIVAKYDNYIYSNDFNNYKFWIL